MRLGEEKKIAGPGASGVLPPGKAKAYDQAVVLPPPALDAANPTLGPVSGQASAEELKGYQKPGDSGDADSVLVLPLPEPTPGAEKVAVGTVSGRVSPEELRGYVKTDAVPAPDTFQSAGAPSSGPVPPEEQRQFRK